MAYQNPEKPVHFSGKQNATPAPKTRDTSFGRTAYGANGFGGRSSDDPGMRTVSPLAADLESGDTALAAVRDHGVRKDDGFQLRGESSKQLPTTFGHRPANDGGAPAGKVPNACGGCDEPVSPTRKP
jgi:hypothetical protein